MPLSHIIHAIHQLNKGRQDDNEAIKHFAAEVFGRLEVLAKTVLEQDKKIKELESNLADVQLLGGKQ